MRSQLLGAFPVPWRLSTNHIICHIAQTLGNAQLVEMDDSHVPRGAFLDLRLQLSEPAQMSIHAGRMKPNPLVIRVVVPGRYVGSFSTLLRAVHPDFHREAHIYSNGSPMVVSQFESELHQVVVVGV